MAFDFTKILERTAKKEFVFIKVTEEHIEFLVNKGKSDLAQTLNSLLVEHESEQALKLPKLNDVTTSEHNGLVNDRASAARIKEFTADIGQELQISATAAEKILTDSSQWGKLSDELKKKLQDYETSLQTFNQDSPNLLGARRVTTILQERLKTAEGRPSGWKHEWTLQLPPLLIEQLINYFEGEASHWESEKEKEKTPLATSLPLTNGHPNTESKLDS